MTASVTIRVDDDEVQALVRRVEGGLDRLVEEVAQELADQVAHEAGQRSQRLGKTWEVKGSGDERRTVEAPEWWAHFLAGGTKDHGPRTKPALVFEANGNLIFAKHVRGITADHFDERAIRDTEHRVDDIIRRLIDGGLPL